MAIRNTDRNAGFRNAELSVIGAATEITGNVTGSGSLRIDGTLRGNVELTGDVEIAREGQVQGDIAGHSLALDGSLIGNATVDGLISIGASASYEGALRADRIAVAPGAQVSAQFEADFELKLSI